MCRAGGSQGGPCRRTPVVQGLCRLAARGGVVQPLLHRGVGRLHPPRWGELWGESAAVRPSLYQDPPGPPMGRCGGWGGAPHS